MAPGQGMTPGGAATGPNGTAPRCEHLDGLAPVAPRSDACPDCPDRKGPLVACLTCGWVACSDASSGQHARAHYEETDHPVVAGLGPGAAWRWCYVHQRLV
jgi:Zn-finger in ubiquitin-hydrolases and other protein